jgi:hypothetical protein
MRNARSRLKEVLTRRSALVILITLAASLFISDARGQSGRKLPNRSEQPEAPTTVPAPAQPAQPAEPKSEKFQTKLLIVRNNSAAYVSPMMAAIVMDSCASYLKKSAGISVNVGGELNRKRASDYAKSSPDVFVLWIDLNADDYDMRRTRTQGSYRDEYQVVYAVFAPGTGKTKASGAVYPRPYQPKVGGTPIPSPVPRTSGSMTLELMLKQSGEEIAERILNALKLDIPGRN